MPIFNLYNRRATVILTALMVSTIASFGTAQETTPWSLTVPTRRLVDAPSLTPPPLQPGAESIKPLTFEVVVRRASRRSGATRQVVARSAVAVHLASSDGREWLFEQNPVDRRRVSATLVEHATKAIVTYEETDLRMALGIRGWVDILNVGFDSDTLGGLARTRDVRSVDGIEFTRYARRPSRSNEDVWWSSEYGLAYRFTTRDDIGLRMVKLEGAKPGVDASLLRPAVLRFPEYRVVAYADSLEKH